MHIQTWKMMLTFHSPSDFSYFPPSSAILSSRRKGIAYRQDWWALARISKNEMAYLDSTYSFFFCVRKTGEGSALEYGLSIGIDSPDQSAISQSVKSLLRHCYSGFVLRCSMAHSRYDLATLPELNSEDEYDDTVSRSKYANIPLMPI